MLTYTKNRRRTQLQVEPLEGKTLLSSGGVVPQVEHHPMAAPVVAQETAPFAGTLTGHYSSVHAPYFAYIQTYGVAGDLSDVGRAHSYGTLFVRPGAPPGRFDGRLVMVNHGGSMILNVYQSSPLGTYSYIVAHAYGSDAAFRGGTGALVITQTPTFSVPYYTQGHATMSFS